MILYSMKRIAAWSVVVAFMFAAVGVTQAQDAGESSESVAAEAQDADAGEAKKEKKSIRVTRRGGGGGAESKVVTGFRNRRVVNAGGLWIGVYCTPVSPELRAHVKIADGQGLVVRHLVKDSPAAKAGFKMHDILLKAGDKKLSSIADLVDAIRDAGKREIKIELIQAGKPKTIAVTPTDQQVVYFPVPVERNRELLIQELNQRLRGGFNDGTLDFTLVRPGVVLNSKNARSTKIRSITVNKNDSKPAEIVVKDDKKEWKVTEDTLDELPEELRAEVKRVLAGKGKAGGRQIRREHWMHLLPRGSRVSTIIKRENDGDLQKRFEEINKRLDALQKAIEKLNK